MKEVEEGTRDMVECFSIRLQCSRQFLSALQQNTAQSRLLYLFYDKESVKFPTCYFLISKTNFIFKAIESAISMFYTFSTNQSTATSELYCKSLYKDYYKLEVIKSKYNAES